MTSLRRMSRTQKQRAIAQLDAAAAELPPAQHTTKSLRLQAEQPLKKRGRTIVHHGSRKKSQCKPRKNAGKVGKLIYDWNKQNSETRWLRVCAAAAGVMSVQY